VDLPPWVVPPEVKVPASDFRFVPSSEFHLPPPTVTPAAGKAVGALAKAFSHVKGGAIVGGIAAALAAAFGAIFGRKREA
jgi:hypothetical protein